MNSIEIILILFRLDMYQFIPNYKLFHPPKLPPHLLHFSIIPHPLHLETILPLVISSITCEEVASERRQLLPVSLLELLLAFIKVVAEAPAEVRMYHRRERLICRLPLGGRVINGLGGIFIRLK
jgi:hypothetical protein